MKTKFTWITLLLVLACTAANAQWQAVNTGLTTNNVNSVVTIGPNVLAGTDAGLFISTNNGNSWTAVADTNFAGQDVKQLAVSGSTVFAATFGHGVFASTDNGVTWAAKNTGFTYLYACGIAVAGTTVYASMSFDGVYTSIDNGTTWVKSTNAVLNGITVNSIIMSGTNMIAASGSCNGGTNGGVFLSTNGGLTWAATSVTGDADALAVIGSTIFAATQNGVFKSADNGLTWNPTTNTSGIIDNATALIAGGTKLLVGCPYSMYSTVDNGTTWSDISTGAGAANLSVTSFAVNSTYVFAGNIYHSVGVWRRPLSELGITAGIEGLSSDDGLIMYPNPVTDKLVLEVSDYKNTTVEVFNLQGQLIQRIVPESSATVISTGSFSPGLYVLKVNSPAGSAVRRFIKE
ncbi:MAG: two component regulator propeller domain protein [Bacteroidetes bacterium]|nr:two component regulator propeller domain protein [Bacteroidota bacterium]